METEIGAASHGQWSWSTAREHFHRVDPILDKIVDPMPDPDMAPSRTAFESLSRAIIGQQLSTKAAATIWSRFSDFHGNVLSPSSVMQTGQDRHRALGVSAQKHGYLQSLAEQFLETPEDFESVSDWNDEAIIRRWTQVKGLGRWTVQMHLMFAMNRPDVFPVDDLGVRRAMERHFDIPADSRRDVYEKRARIWGPFRTAACRFLWMSFDNQPR